MSKLTLIMGNKSYSSLSLRICVFLKQKQNENEEIVEDEIDV